MKHLIEPQPSAQDIEDALAKRDWYVGIVRDVWPELTPSQIDAAWEAMAAEVRAHTPPTTFAVIKGFTDRLARL